jgi:hypothetical protein
MVALLALFHERCGLPRQRVMKVEAGALGLGLVLASAADYLASA